MVLFTTTTPKVLRESCHHHGAQSPRHHQDYQLPQCSAAELPFPSGSKNDYTSAPALLGRPFSGGARGVCKPGLIVLPRQHRHGGREGPARRCRCGRTERRVSNRDPGVLVPRPLPPEVPRNPASRHKSWASVVLFEDSGAWTLSPFLPLRSRSLGPLSTPEPRSPAPSVLFLLEGSGLHPDQSIMT